MTPTADQAQQAQRAVRGREFTAAYVFGLDGDPLPTSGVTLTVTDAEGNVVIGPVAATVDAEVDDTVKAHHLITAAELPNRDFLTALWSATIDTATVVQVSTIDVCDARLFPLADYLADTPLVNRGFSPDQLELARMFAEDRLELECGCAFTGRYGSEHFTLDEPNAYISLYAQPLSPPPQLASAGVQRLSLRQPSVQVIRSITQTTLEAGVPTTSTLDLDFTRLDTVNSVLFYTDANGNGMQGDVTVTYEHGQPVPDQRRVCFLLARYRLLNGPIDQRATSINIEGVGNIALLSPGMGGSVFGIPELDVFLQRRNRHALGFISAGR